MQFVKPAIAFSAVLGMTALVNAQNQPPQNPQNTQDRQNPNLQQNQGTSSMQPRSMNQGQAVAAPQWPAGFTSKEVDEREDILNTIASATEAALTERSFDDLIERLSKPDRDRISQNDFDNRDFPNLNQRATQLREKFRQKYGADFNINDNRAFEQFTVVQGQVSDVNLVRNSFPLPAIAGRMDASNAVGAAADDRARTAAGRTDAQGAANTQDQNYLINGRDVAIVVLPGQQSGAQPLQVSLAQEMIDAWRIDIPDSVTGQKLHDNLVRHLDELNSSSALWPANADDAKRIFAYHIVAALYDTGSMSGMQQGTMQQGQQGTQGQQQMDRTTPSGSGTPSAR